MFLPFMQVHPFAGKEVLASNYGNAVRFSREASRDTERMRAWKRAMPAHEKGGKP
jgi:hypothetical protein